LMLMLVHFDLVCTNQGSKPPHLLELRDA
jgi:hypothetical protein